MTPQEELARYFEVCGYAPDDLISIGTRAGAEGPLFFSFTTVADAPKQIVARKGVNCWIGANPTRRPEPTPENRNPRGSVSDVTAVRALWADLDIKPGGMPDKASATAVMKEVSNLLGVKPVAVVWSGHGFQPRWKIDIGELHSPERMTPVIEAFGRLVQMVAERHGGKADAVYDLARIIRAPHTTNIKPGMEPAPTKVWLYPDAAELTFERLLEVIDAYLPAAPVSEPAAPTENRHVGTERGNAYVVGALDLIRAELQSIKSWAAGQTDDRGRGWEKIQADAAFRLASLAKADWNELTVEKAMEIFVDNAPIDETWTIRDVIKKWKSQVRRAEPADPPGDSDDPLSGGGGSPHRSAAVEAAIWSGDSDGGDVSGPAARGEGESREGDVGDPDGRGDRGLDRPETAARDDRVQEENLELTWRKFPTHDVGNVDRLIERFGDELRFVESLDRWLRYTDGAWRESKLGGQNAAMALLREVYQLEANFYSDVEYRKGKTVTSERSEFHKWCQEQQSTARIKAAAEAAKFDGRLTCSADAFDSYEMLLNAANGVIDLETGELIEHHPALMLRRQIQVAYVPGAEAPQWEKFLDRVMPSLDMRNYLQRIIGYTLTGDTGDQAVFVHWGPPASGKSVFLRILEAILGEFSRVVPPTTLLTKKAESHPTDIMGLEGRRMLQVSELPEGARLDEPLVKRLSGEETITARGMGQDFRDFKITGKVHLVTNHLPHITDDQATHRRLHLVKWGVTIPEEERDPLLASRIIAEELEGVLAWAVRGTLAWKKNRLPKSRPVEAELDRAEYIGSEDEFGQFLEEELIIGADSFTPSKDVYRRYVQYCDSLRMKPMSMIAFGRKLSARGVEPRKERIGGSQVRGFRVALALAAWARQDPLG